MNPHGLSPEAQGQVMTSGGLSPSPPVTQGWSLSSKARPHVLDGSVRGFESWFWSQTQMWGQVLPVPTRRGVSY